MFNSPIFGITITLFFYYVSMKISKRFPTLHPLLLTVGGIILFLFITGIPYSDYAQGGEMLSFFLGPATVALAVPIYKHFSTIKHALGNILLSISLGHIVGVLSVLVSFHFLGGTKEVIASMLPKSVTTPISIELSRLLGGVPELTGLFTVLAGLIGSMFGQSVLRLFGIKEDIPIATAIGTASHGIGTARLLQENMERGSISGFAMGISGIILSMIITLASKWNLL